MENNLNKIKRIRDSIRRDNERVDEIKQEIYKVGYKRPPISGQFKKGVSGNPRGRKKKELPRTILEALQLAFIKEATITNEKGSRERISFIQLFAQKIVQDAIKNDGPSRKMLLQNLKLLNFDFLRMLENKAMEDFEPETSEEDKRYYKQCLDNIFDNYFRNLPDDQ